MPRYDDDYSRISAMGGATAPPVPPPPAPTPPPDYVPPSVKDPGTFDTNISKEQWQAWEKEKMAGCPENAPYKGRSGQCAAKPDDCPEGQQVVGNDASGTAHCVDSSSLNKPQASAQAATPQAAQVAQAPPPGPGTYTPPQTPDPLKVSGLGQASGIQTNPTAFTGGPAAAGTPSFGGGPTAEVQKKKATGLMGAVPSMTQGPTMGMH